MCSNSELISWSLSAAASRLLDWCVSALARATSPEGSAVTGVISAVEDISCCSDEILGDEEYIKVALANPCGDVLVSNVRCMVVFAWC